MKRSRGVHAPARSKAPAMEPKRAKTAPPEDPSSEEEADPMSHAPVFRSLSVDAPPAVPLVFRAPSPPKSFPPTTPAISAKPHSIVTRTEAQSPVHLVTEKDLLKRVLRKKFDAEFLPVQQTPERWSSWIDEKWNKLSHSEQRIFYSECERINYAAYAAQERRATSAPAICGPAAGL